MTPLEPRSKSASLDNPPVDEELDLLLVEVAEACIAGNPGSAADGCRKAHARFFAAHAEGFAEARRACVDELTKRFGRQIRGAVIEAIGALVPSGSGDNE